MRPSDAKQTVVIVEDDVAVRQATERVLGLRGIATASYPSAETALADGSAAQAACLIVDIRLPGISGLEMCQRLAREGTLPPVVFVTAHDEEHLRDAAMRLGAVGVLAKPFSGRDLVDLVNDILDRGRSAANGAGRPVSRKRR